MSTAMTISTLNPELLRLVLHRNTSPKCSRGGSSWPNHKTNSQVKLIGQSYRRSRPASSRFGCSFCHRCTTNKYQNVWPKKFCCLWTSWLSSGTDFRPLSTTLNCCWTVSVENSSKDILFPHSLSAWTSANSRHPPVMRARQHQT